MLKTTVMVAAVIAAAMYGKMCTAQETVVLVHGMGRSKLSMTLLARFLEKQNFRVVNWQYNSFTQIIPEITPKLEPVVSALEKNTTVTKIHFVGHSLGNIIIRDRLSRRSFSKAGRVVMLAPPNQGSRLADRLHWIMWPILRPINELTTDTGSLVRSLPPIPQEIGIIIGQRDGKVSIAESHLTGERDHLVVDAGHAFLMNKLSVQNQIVQFLNAGEFGRNE